MRSSLTLRPLGAGLALVLAAAALAVGVARAGQTVHPTDSQASVGSLRALVDHYRALAWTYQRAARVPRTATSFSYRRSSDQALSPGGRSTPGRGAPTGPAPGARRDPPAPRGAAARPARPACLGVDQASFQPPADAAPPPDLSGQGHPGVRERPRRERPPALRLWQAAQRGGRPARRAARRRRPALPGWLLADFSCIHRYEGGWTSNTGNGYYGGLQMDIAFQRLYGADFLARFGTADTWPVWAQFQAAARAYASGRGFAPWPNTARACGLL